MSALTRTLALLTLAFWGLASAHCQLEQVPGLEFLACCQHPGTAPHQDNDCDHDGCAVVESGLYYAAMQVVSAPVPFLVSGVLPFVEYTVPRILPVLARPPSPPPELARSWQFSRRLARLPRAPSPFC